jgi:dipeptidase
MISTNGRLAPKTALMIPLIFIAGILCSRPSTACTIVVAGRKATVDGSVITSHTDACDDSRLYYVPAKKHDEGSLAPVYWGLQDPSIAHGEWEVIGHIPQVERTFAYFHSGYSHINERQLAIGESTTSQRSELGVNRETGEQIITVEQAMIFALQRCETAREAVALITSLVDEYGYLPSCGPESETLAIADPHEAWILEIFSIGPGWRKGSGKPGALWAARRVPDDHVAMVPNWSVIREIDISQPEWFIASENYMQVAIDNGWYKPEDGPFIWQEAYTPVAREWATSRFWLFYSTFCPSLKEWPDRTLDGPHEKYDSYHQYVEDLSIYPFSAPPYEKVSVKDVMAFQRSTFEGTIYDMTADHDWLVPDGEGGFVKSPLATPFPTPDMRHLLDIDFRRNVAKGGYGMVAQLRGFLPDVVGGVYWYFVDNQHVGSYVPIYAGVTKIHPAWNTYDPSSYSEESHRWAVDFVDNLLYLKWQSAIGDVRAVRDPVEARYFDEMAAVDEKAAGLYEKSPKKAAKYLTELTLERMEEMHGIYTAMRDSLITNYTNNHVRP